MTLNEVKNFLNQNCHYRKSDMRSIKNIAEMAKECMLTLTKNNTDDYSLSENFAIKDFRKPLIIDRTIRFTNNKEFVVNDINIISFISDCMNKQFNPRLWCYLANKKDGDIIDFDYYFDNHWVLSPELLAQEFDDLVLDGYLEETDKNIIFHFEPIEVNLGRIQWWEENYPHRFTPINK